jgi:hypothetical protein
MVSKGALIESGNRGVMLNESEADVLAVEAVGTSEERHATDGKVANPNARQIATRCPCTMSYRRAHHYRCDHSCTQEPKPNTPHDSPRVRSRLLALIIFRLLTLLE